MSATHGIAQTPLPPYYAVIFTSKRTASDDSGYAATSQRMVDLGSRYDGFLGMESVRDGGGLGITVSYWRDEAALLAWKRDTEHQKAQRGGRGAWYERFEVRVAKVERAYGFAREPAA
jgi:heme-degrading monooxygenase HmoA